MIVTEEMDHPSSNYYHYANNIENETLHELPEPSLTPIQEFFDNVSVFVTGGTGFMGKMITEKLLRSCPGVKHIYLLIRPKKGKDMFERVELLLDDPIFDRLKEETPKFRHKIIGIAGDVSLPGLGLSENDRQILIENVNVAIHGAATVKFDEQLKTAVAINVQGTKEMVALIRKIRNLKACAHISTAYCNSNRSEIDEIFYPSAMSAESLIALAGSLKTSVLDNITPTILDGWPNTYTFTKAVAENYINSNCQDLPIVVFRPAIIVSSYKEPIPGWIDNIYGPTGVVAGTGAGLLRTILADPKVVSDMVPIDLVVNALLASIWHRGITRKIDNIPIYNYVSSLRNPINFQQFFEYNMTHGLKNPSVRAVWYYSISLTSSKLMYNIYIILYHILPASIIDLGLLIVGKKPQAIKIYKKIHKFISVVQFFSIRTWLFHENKVLSLWDSLNSQDKEIFNFDIQCFKWFDFTEKSVKGLRLFIFKEEPETIPTALRRLQMLKYLHYTLKYCGLIILLWIFFLFWRSVF